MSSGLRLCLPSFSVILSLTAIKITVVILILFCLKSLERYKNKKQNRMTEIVKSGYLYKQSRHLKHWRNRWCVITQDNLLTYKNQDLFSHPTERIPLNSILSITEDRVSTSVLVFQSSMKIIETVDGKKFLFDAICFRDKNDWLATLRRAVETWFDRNRGDGWKRLQRTEVEQICY